MQYRDSSREELYQTRKTLMLDTKADNVATMKQKTFNIVSHQGGGPRRVESRKTDYRPARPCHPISNLDNQDHQQAPTVYNEDYALTKFRPNTVRAATSLGAQRDFNVVSNEYVSNHATRRLEDFDKLKSHLLEKYWDTHDYDMIKGRYYSPQKERQYKEQAATLTRAHGMAQEERLPPSIKYADGNSYNILTHECDDEERLKVTMTMANRSMNRMKKMEKEAIMVEECNMRASVQEKLKMNKISFKHWENHMDRGFNFITNEPVSNPPAPLPSRPATMWARLTASSVDGPIGLEGTTAPTGSRFPALHTASEDGRGSAKVRNLSGTGPRLFAQTTKETARTARVGTAVPSLNLSTTEFAEPVAYKEPTKGAPGMAVEIVRTGGLSAHGL